MTPHLHRSDCDCLRVNHPSGSMFLDERELTRARLRLILAEEHDSQVGNLRLSLEEA